MCGRVSLCALQRSKHLPRALSHRDLGTITTHKSPLMLLHKTLSALLLTAALSGCQSAPESKTDAPTPKETPKDAPKGAPLASCCPSGTSEVGADQCADDACIQLELDEGPLLCRAPATPAGAEEPEPQVCDAFLGYQWLGDTCAGASGCTRGAGVWYDTKEQCEQAHAHCHPAPLKM